jgi:hypothetical protein
VKTDDYTTCKIDVGPKLTGAIVQLVAELEQSILGQNLETEVD